MYRAPIELVDGLVDRLWMAIQTWSAIPATEQTLEARIQAAAEVENVVATALNLQGLIDARAALDRLAYRSREGGPDMPREEVRTLAMFAAERINEIVPRSPLRSFRAAKEGE